MITDIVVFASVILAAAFSVAWLFRPGLRDAIERPKFSFQENVKNYDRTRNARS